MLNSLGPRTDPGGTPHLMELNVDFISLLIIHCRVSPLKIFKSLNAYMGFSIDVNVCHIYCFYNILKENYQNVLKMYLFS